MRGFTSVILAKAGIQTLCATLSELILSEVEGWACAAALVSPLSFDFAQDELREDWNSHTGSRLSPG